MVRDIYPGKNLDGPQDLYLVYNNQLYFTAQDTTNGIESGAPMTDQMGLCCLWMPVQMIGWDENAPNALEVNQQWIRSLKENGYTFYDMGYDPAFSTKGQSEFYDMELLEVFDGVQPPWPPIEIKIP